MINSPASRGIRGMINPFSPGSSNGKRFPTTNNPTASSTSEMYNLATGANQSYSPWVGGGGTRYANGDTLITSKAQMPYYSTEQWLDKGKTQLNPLWSASKIGNTTTYEQDGDLTGYVNEYNTLLKKAKMGSPLTDEENSRIDELYRTISRYNRGPRQV